MKSLIQKHSTITDSFIYIVRGEDKPHYIVCSDGCLYERGKEIGRFRIQGNHQWYLVLDGEGVFMTSPVNSLFMLPEFEIEALTALINK